MNADQLLAHYEMVTDAPDAIPRLRRFILDLAVRGKLVEQDPVDEPASELLKRIETVKAGLVKAKAIRKPKLLAGFEKYPYDLPPSWRWTRMRQVTSDRGQAVPDAPFTYIDVTAIDKENGFVADPKVLQANEAPSRARKIVRQGDVIYSCVRPYLLNVAIVESDFDPAPIASTAFAILNGHGLVLPPYLWIVLRSPFMVECVEVDMRGQAYPAINDSDFSVLPFPLPPLAEQHRIVAKVDELMALCDRLAAARARREATRDRLAAASLARLNAPDPDPAVFQSHSKFALDNLAPLTTRPDEIKQLRQTILNLAVRGKLVEQDTADEPASELLYTLEQKRKQLVADNKLRKSKSLAPPTSEDTEFELPPGWAISLLGTVFDVRDGTHDTPKYVDDGYPLITSKNLSSGSLSFEDVKFIGEADQNKISERSLVERDDILLAMIGSIGNPVIVDTDRIFSIKNVALFKYVDRLKSSPEYLRYFLINASNHMKNLAAGGLQPFVSLGFLRSYPIPLPPLAEQRRIVTKVDELMTLCDRLEAALDTADTTRQRLFEAMLHEVLSPGDDQEAA